MNFDIVFDPDTHEYIVDGKTDYPSVTTILGYITQAEYEQINPSILDYAKRRGALVHEVCEAFDLDFEPEIWYNEVTNYVNAYRDFMRDYRCRWEQIENIVISQKYHFIGTLDRAGIIDGKQCVVDIKTIDSPTKLNKFSVCCQTAAYAIAREEMYGVKTDKRFAVYLKKNGDYSLFDCGLYELKYGIDAFEIFHKCLAFYNSMDQLKNAKPIKRKVWHE